jgi:hypothetical protein
MGEGYLAQCDAATAVPYGVLGSKAAGRGHGSRGPCQLFCSVPCARWADEDGVVERSLPYCLRQRA